MVEEALSARSQARYMALSPSRIADFELCPLKYRFGAIDRIPQEPTDYLVRGTLTHLVLEKLFDLPSPSRTLENARASIQPLWEYLQKKNPEYLFLFSPDNPQRIDEKIWLESVHSLIDGYFQMEYPQNLEPAHREYDVRTVTPLGVKIRGFVDRIDTSAQGKIRIVDYKTGKSPRKGYENKALFQLNFYSTALYLMHGKAATRTQLLYIKEGKSLTYDPSPSDIDATIEKIDETWRGISTRLQRGYFEARRNRLCNWCPFQHLCPAFGAIAPDMDEEGARAASAMGPRV